MEFAENLGYTYISWGFPTPPEFQFRTIMKAVRQLSTSSRILANYGFIGLGQMGQHMARHIYNQLEPNDSLYVHDVLRDATETFVNTVTSASPDRKDCLKALYNISDFVTGVNAQLDYIITMVPEGRHVKGVVQQLIETYQQGAPSTTKTTILDSSTIDIPTSIEVHNYVKQQIPEFDFIDTPVSGGVAGARKGTLSFMLSRPTDESISPSLNTLLKKMGKNIFPCGANHGAGLAAKLSNNYLLAVTNLAVADSFRLAHSFGLDLVKYSKLVAVSTGKCWAAVDNCPIPGVYPAEYRLPVDDGYNGGFITKLTKKDLVLATDAAKFNDRFLFMGDVSRHWYEKACEREDIASRDLAVLYEWLGDLEQQADGTIVDKKDV